jgi:hypothetical protein
VTEIRACPQIQDRAGRSEEPRSRRATRAHGRSHVTLEQGRERSPQQAQFHPASERTQEDVLAIVARASKRILRFLQRRGVITLVTAPGDGEVTVVTDESPVGFSDSQKLLRIAYGRRPKDIANNIARASEGVKIAEEQVGQTATVGFDRPGDRVAQPGS